MGGSVFIGIRKRNGEIYMAERWTNPTPYWFNDPDFYNPNEITLNEYINLAKEPRLQTEIHPSSYGVILYDAPSGKLLSRQGYTTIGTLHVSLNDIDKLKIVDRLSQNFSWFKFTKLFTTFINSGINFLKDFGVGSPEILAEVETNGFFIRSINL